MVEMFLGECSIIDVAGLVQVGQATAVTQIQQLTRSSI